MYSTLELKRQNNCKYSYISSRKSTAPITWLVNHLFANNVVFILFKFDLFANFILFKDETGNSADASALTSLFQPKLSTRVMVMCIKVGR